MNKIINNMENYTVKLEIVNNEGKVIGATKIENNAIKEMNELHGVNVLNEMYDQLMVEINK